MLLVWNQMSQNEEKIRNDKAYWREVKSAAMK